MVEAPGLAIAFAAGLASFLSPCCLPLVPGYLAAVFGRDPNASPSAAQRARVLGRSAAFVSTFSLLFIAFGLTATALGQALFDSQPLLNKIGGATMIAMGAVFAAAPFTATFSGQWKLPALSRRAGDGSPIIAGAAFAIAWTPCVGPTLGAILGLAATTNGTGQGALLLAIYSAGLALPFLISALAYERAMQSFAWFKRHYTAVQVTSGILLAVMGVLVFTGELFQLNLLLQDALDAIGLNFWQNL